MRGVDLLPPKILVTDAGLGSALAVIRSLGRRGWEVVAADSDPRSLGFYSRFAHEKLIYPPPEKAPRGMVETLREAAQAKNIDLIIPVTDAVILPLAAARTAFEGYCQLALPEDSALERATNKLKTLELAQRLDVPIPSTRLVNTAREALEQAPSLGWPVVLKPLRSRLYHTRRRTPEAIEKLTVCYADTPERLEQRMKRFEARCPVLMQQYYPGLGYGVELLTHQGRPLAAFQHKRLREIPVYGGASAYRESVPLEPNLFRHARCLLQALNWTGLAMVEFKVGAEGAKLMEINGRIWGSLPLAVHSGMDFPRRLVELYLSNPPREDPGLNCSYITGVRSRNLELDLMWIATVLFGRQRYPFLKAPSRLQALRALIGLFNPTSKFDVWSPGDPLPGVFEILRIMKKFSMKLSEAS